MFANFNLFLQQISTKKIAFIGIGISNLNVINLIIEKCKNPSSLYILDSDDRISSNKHVLKLTQLGVNLICGKNYLQNKFPRYKSKIKTSFLGTKGYGVEQYKKGKVLRIVSCSNVVPVKRLDLIIKTLMNLKDVDIEWTHFG